MKLKLAQVLSVVIAVWLAVIFTLYLAPSKHPMGDVLAALLLVCVVVVLGVRKSGCIDGVKHLGPLLLMLLYVFVLAVVNRQSSNLLYARELLAGFVPFLSLYAVFRFQNPLNLKILFVGVFILPGLVHLGYMWFDILTAFLSDEIFFQSNLKHGLLEDIKNAPRVGRRYLSIALVHVLFGCALLVKMSSHASWKRGGYGLSALAIFSLGVLDARAAYVSVGLGAVLLVLFVARNGAHFICKITDGASLSFKFLSIALIILTAVVAYSAGKSRWIAMSYSFQAAINDVFYGDDDVSARPYVDKMFWDLPIADPQKCYQEGQFRCRADQSAYLRLAWLMEGVRSLASHPFGVGYSSNYMGRLWGSEGDESKFQRIDSSLAEHIVWFGVIGLTFYTWFGWVIARSARTTLISSRDIQSQAIVLIALLIFVCAARGVFDLITEGAWRYLMALVGLYYGTIHSISTKRASNFATRSLLRML